MKHRHIFLFFLFSMFFYASAQEIVVVANFKTNSKISQREAQALNLSFLMNFHPQGYKVIDQLEMRQLMKEKHVSCDTLTDNQMFHIARFLGLEKMVTGEISLIGKKMSMEVNMTDLRADETFTCVERGFAMDKYEKSMRKIARKLSSKLKAHQRKDKAHSVKEQEVEQSSFDSLFTEKGKTDAPESIEVENKADQDMEQESEHERMSGHHRRCLENKVVDTDGNVYGTVYIGGQCWMKENMRSTHNRNGKEVWYYPPNNNFKNKFEYGFLYDWDSAKEICPSGWHLPTDNEWVLLEQNISIDQKNVCDTNPQNIAKAMCSTWGWENSKTECSIGNKPYNNNATGFDILPAGIYNSGPFGFGVYTNFWCATELQNGFAYSHGFNCNKADVIRYVDGKESGFSVRCVKN